MFISAEEGLVRSLGQLVCTTNVDMDFRVKSKMMTYHILD